MVQQFFRMFTVGGLILVAVVVLLTRVRAGEPGLKIVAGSQGMATIELESEKPVRALQFAVTGITITEMRATDRTRGFLIKFNEQNGKAIILSTSGGEIDPGKGPVAEIIFDKEGSPTLAEVKIIEKQE